MTFRVIAAAGLALFLSRATVFAQPLPATAPAGEKTLLRGADLPPVRVYPTPAGAPVEIVRGGQPRAVVYVAEAKPSATLVRMVQELGEVVKLSTGAELVTVAAPPAPDQAAMIIGDCAESRQAGIEADQLPLEGFEVKTAGKRVFLVGSTQALPPNAGYNDQYGNEGTAWAVADFLERFVGVRWYWPTEVGGRCLTMTDTLTVPAVHYSDEPAFRMREFSNTREGYTRPFASRWEHNNGVTPSAEAIPPELNRIAMAPLLDCLRAGTSWPYKIKVHMPQQVWKDQGLVQQHPELFELKENGERNFSMLCYGNQATLAFLLAGCEAYWDNNPAAMAPWNNHGPSWVTGTCVTVSPFDEPVHCYCPDCAPLYDPTGGGGDGYGSASEIMGRFVKKMCEAVKQRWPDRKVLFLAYTNYTVCPAEVDFPDNLEIQQCTMATGLMRQADARKLMEDNERAWSRKVGGKITTWEYPHRVPEWTNAPVQYPHVIQSYYRDQRDVLAGSFLNAGGISEWSKAAPTDYCLLRLLWNPEMNVDAMLDEMCRRLFGKAAGPARELLRLECDRWEGAPWRESVGDAGRIPARVFADTWPPQVVAQMEKLRQQAREKTKDDLVARQRLAYWTWSFDAFLQEAQEQWALAQKN